MSTTYKGIDVSKWQGVIDWEKVKADGVEFAILRAGYGQSGIDEQFERNAQECTRLGIPFGVYWFSYAYTTALAEREAERFLEMMDSRFVSAGVKLGRKKREFLYVRSNNDVSGFDGVYNVILLNCKVNGNYKLSMNDLLVYTRP